MVIESWAAIVLRPFLVGCLAVGTWSIVPYKTAWQSRRLNRRLGEGGSSEKGQGGEGCEWGHCGADDGSLIGLVRVLVRLSFGVFRR